MEETSRTQVANQKKHLNFVVTKCIFTPLLYLVFTEAPPAADPPTVVIPPVLYNAQKSVGENMDLLCAFEGCPVPNVVWYHNDQEMDFQDTRLSTVETKSHNFVASQLFITGLTAEDSGSYHCRGTNSEDSADTPPVILSVGSKRKRSAEEEDSTQSFPCSQDDGK